MSEFLIANTKIILADTILNHHDVLVSDGIIQKILPAGNRPPVTIVDGKGHYLCPGFIDLHFHGIHTRLVDNGLQDVAEICRILPRYGVTGFLPTVCPLPKGKDVAFLRTLVSGDYTGTEILGFHLEGPFLSLTGALPPEALGGADLDRVKGLMDAAKPYTAIFSISPEFEGIASLLPSMTANNTPAFITHTKGNVSETLTAIAAGACHATHFYDVFYTPDMTEPGVRPCGAVEAILASTQVSVDFILDGVHVDPIAVKMALQCKGNDKVCLITDANIGAGLGAGRYKFGKEDVTIAAAGAPARLAKSNGLAGSGLTMNLAVKNTVQMLGVDLPLAVKMASANPAKVLRLSNKGTIQEGYDADLILMDKDFNVLKTWINGTCYYQK